ncbi:MAG: orotate phosphoribosyltransferase [Candidatus Cloacimonadaceae bacterium]|jgi:orotate phosphoribosyltransferase|nr:orotate phosphoribosyltransferase [Candidatus Cloacimonadota bacterium]MDY0126647.1 orotate phosphoribosyltransferase [Candidatus Cloacimonadaceae bacterium]MCB5255260.1 orotate phosphoribosyltransferase [Candidatus Cloacimonadota bacterium]MCK9177482.1 orotate phosphoribosyltransferase [Candidatus Cloacimonadota bacterium]MCK9242746.1 orotate phosphoribosyltransferase [Candidatus Cloacimonadota bacterium]
MADNLVTIARYTEIFEAEMAKGFLEDSGFEVFLQNERILGLYPSMAGDMYMVELQVFADAEEDASTLLEDLDDSYLCANILKQENALMEGHFQLTSGNHSDQYIEKISVLQNPVATHTLCNRLAKRLQEFDFDTVIGPAFGAIVLAFDVARILDKGFVFTQRKGGQMVFRDGFDLSKVKKAVIIEDVVSTGGSVQEVIKCAAEQGIKIAAIGLMVDRSAGKIDFGVPVESLLTLDVPLWAPEDCELCKQGISLSKPGSSDK